MIFNSIHPTAACAPFIKSIWTLEGTEDELNSRYRFTPDGYVELMFHLAEPWGAIVNGEDEVFRGVTKFVGQFSKCLDVVLPASLKVAYIKFYPWVAYSLFGIPMSEFSNNNVELSEVFNSEINDLQDQLIQSVGLVEIRSYIETWLLRQLKDFQEIDKEAVQMAALIMKDGAHVQLPEILSRYSRSQRRLQQQFSDLVGVSPKSFARIRRVFMATRVVRETTNFTQLAYDLGYFDQSHFIRDFKYFTGLSPKQYTKHISPNGKTNNFSID